VIIKDITQFLSEVKSELGKVTWPGYNELVGSIIIVLVVVFIFSIYFGVVDLFFYKCAGRIFS
jgi:preprotein translocase subunit SecE